MSATKPVLTFPTPDEASAAELAMGRAFDALEKLQRRVRIIASDYEDKEEIHDRPTLETIGLLATFIDAIEGDHAEIGRSLAELRVDLKHVMAMRDELETVAS